MDFNILGPIEAVEGGRPLALGGAKQRALLGMLVLHANEVVSSDRLIDELWAGDGRAEAIRSLQVAISRLRKALDAGPAAGAGNGTIVTRSPGYELRVDPERLDSARFERLVAKGRRALAAVTHGRRGRPSTAPCAYGGALHSLTSRTSRSHSPRSHASRK
jgi:DNA-binding SARP family transcriptional activator